MTFKSTKQFTPMLQAKIRTNNKSFICNFFYFQREFFKNGNYLTDKGYQLKHVAEKGHFSCKII